jgi:hypothetical protein
VTPVFYAKLGGTIFACLLLSGGGYYFGGLRGDAKAAHAQTALEADHEAMAKAATDALLAQRSQAAAQAITDNTAEKAHDQTIEDLPGRVVRTPVFLRSPGEICPGPVPGAKAKTGGEHSGGSGVQPGSGKDLRPAIEAMKVKYETALADCRRLDAQWPK